MLVKTKPLSTDTLNKVSQLTDTELHYLIATVRSKRCHGTNQIFQVQQQRYARNLSATQRRIIKKIVDQVAESKQLVLLTYAIEQL